MGKKIRGEFIAGSLALEGGLRVRSRELASLVCSSIFERKEETMSLYRPSLPNNAENLVLGSHLCNRI